ncbi:cytochrome P450 [Suillus clintonianus]|uniref:cytochrome P450 n=1 Tax=Suillus clintonianus TaxID=1904413 RepID=UPI001B87B365|nr:cytochrome P450 [Suillus clintonianus]KAG2148121.1 cytochrome P450 [Suillus clintonianus]
MVTLIGITWPNLLCLAGVGVYLLTRVFKKKNPAPYPPGPQGWPLIGNVLDMPHIKPWLTFTQWGKKYGDISHMEVLGQHIIVVNSVKTALNMLDKKSNMYSDRPVFPMGGELVGLKYTLGFLTYGDRFRQYRKTIHHIIGTRAAVEAYNQIEEVESHRFLKRVLERPNQLQAHVRLLVGAIILRISHGYEVKENNDPFIDTADRALDRASRATAHGAFMVDIMPSLAKVPEWFPGAGFKRLAREWNMIVEEMVAAPYQFVKDQMAAGIAPKSFTSALLEGKTLTEEEDHVAKWCAGSLYSGGADTVGPFLPMTLFPDIQKKAQAEIDAVIGPDRLPTLADRASLPYTEAVAKEVLRWNVVSPIGFPHRVTEDDIHDGYYIPKGSLVIPNIWFMLNNPETYANPSEFNPERFLGKRPEPEPRTVCFGFGRRICPGLLLAEASVWMSTARSLAVFNISKAVENGVEITPEIDRSTGTISHPTAFKCSIEPRSAKAIGLIEQDYGINYGEFKLYGGHLVTLRVAANP